MLTKVGNREFKSPAYLADAKLELTFEDDARYGTEPNRPIVDLKITILFATIEELKTFVEKEIFEEAEESDKVPL